MTPRYHLDEIPDREPAPALLRYRTRNPRGTPVPGAERDRMELTALLVILIIGAVAGWLAGLIVKGYGFGLVGNIVVGIIGAFIAGWLFPYLGLRVGSPIVGAIISATIGAVILLGVISLVKRA